MNDVGFQKVGSIKVADDLQAVHAIARKLTKHYPGHLWNILWDEDGGVCNIICQTVQHPLMTNSLYAYTLHIKTINADPDLKCVMRAGGEILERARLDRHRFLDGVVPSRVDGVAPKHQPLLNAHGNPILN